MQVKIARFELYPEEEPTGYAVGFTITTSNNRVFYRDTVVSLDVSEQRTDEEIVQEAWNELKDAILSEVERLERKSQIIGKTLILPDGLLEDELPEPSAGEEGEEEEEEGGE